MHACTVPSACAWQVVVLVLFSFGQVGFVLVQFWFSVSSVVAKFWFSLGSVLIQFLFSIGSVVVQFGSVVVQC